MPDSDSRVHGGTPPGDPSGGVQELIVRAQRLATTPRPVDGYPLAWHVEARHVGDMTALVAAALRGHPAAPVTRGR